MRIGIHKEDSTQEVSENNANTFAHSANNRMFTLSR